jgi:hypothetical protein
LWKGCAVSRGGDLGLWWFEDKILIAAARMSAVPDNKC